LPVVLGEVARGRARQTEQAEERAALAEERAALAEAVQEAEALRRATEERLRIARELHDVLGHQLSLISVQSGAALHTREPDAAFAALRAVREASRDALREMRSVLGVLREPEQPGLGALPELFERTGTAGLTVHATIEPDLSPPPDVQLAAYRIVQEALTNAVRHSTASRADVVIRRSGGALSVTVADPGEPRAGSGRETAGNGLRGMAERAASLGGALEAGPIPGSGFQVSARLPLDRKGSR
ncbi:sensor histidine kinase, partial [Actinoplanes utahensis]